MYKKLVLLIICLFTFISVNAKEYKVKDSDLTLVLDDEWKIIDIDNYKGNPLLSEFDMDEKQFEEFFKENEIYASALKYTDGVVLDDLTIGYEEDDEIKNLTNYDEDFIKKKADLYAIAFDKEFTIVDKGFYENENNKYLYLHYSNDSNYWCYYETVVNSKTYFIVYRTSKNVTDETIKDYRESIIDKAIFDQDNSLVEESGFKRFIRLFVDYTYKWRYLVICLVLAILSLFRNKINDKKASVEPNDDFWNNKAQ